MNDQRPSFLVGEVRREISRRGFLAVAGGLLLTACIGGSASPEEITDGVTDRGRLLQRLYVPMRDEIRIAVDVWLPEAAETRHVPTVLRATRYGRSYRTDSGSPEDDANAEEARRWADRGYALVVVDARGSGASFGSRQFDLAPDEIGDYAEILAWVAAQEWSNGRVGSYGVSYAGDTAELMASTRSPHLVAIAPLFSDFDPYRQLIYPGGAYLEGPFSSWLHANDVLDGIVGSVERLADALGVEPATIEAALPTPAPVDGPNGMALLEEARLEHQANGRLVERVPALENRENEWIDAAVASHQSDIEASGVPIFVQAGWYDAGTAAGSLERFARFSNHQEVWIGPWNHGGSEALDPAGLGATLDFEDVPFDAQFHRLADFFDRYVRDGAQATAAKTLRFTTLGVSGWTETNVWPLATVEDEVWFLDEDRLLTDAPSEQTSVELPNGLHTSGATSRWAMNVGGENVDYRSWPKDAESRRSFIGAPLDAEMLITGFPVLALDVVSSESDGAIHAYLEEVTPGGTVRYLTEGVLRLVHRGLTPPPISTDLPIKRSFLAANRAPMPIGEPTRIVTELFPISIIVPVGSRLQLSLAASDVDNFAVYGGSPNLVLGGADPAHLVLPVQRPHD